MTAAILAALFCAATFAICRACMVESERTIQWAHREFYNSPRAADRFPRPSMFRRIVLMVLFIHLKY